MNADHNEQQRIPVGSTVDVEARTGPGMNKEGGRAQVTCVTYTDTGRITYNVKYYISSCREVGVDQDFVTLHDNAAISAADIGRKTRKDSATAAILAQSTRSSHSRVAASSAALLPHPSDTNKRERHTTALNRRVFHDSEDEDGGDDYCAKKRKRIATSGSSDEEDDEDGMDIAEEAIDVDTKAKEPDIAVQNSSAATLQGRVKRKNTDETTDALESKRQRTTFGTKDIRHWFPSSRNTSSGKASAATSAEYIMIDSSSDEHEDEDSSKVSSSKASCGNASSDKASGVASDECIVIDSSSDEDEEKVPPKGKVLFSGAEVSFEISHGDALFMPRAVSGSLDKSVEHKASNNIGGITIAGDLIPKVRADSSGNSDNKNKKENIAALKNLEGSTEFAEALLAEGLTLVRTPLFDDYEPIANHVFKLIDEKSLTSVYYASTKSASSGGDTKRCERLLREIPQFHKFLDCLNKAFYVKSLWIRTSESGELLWHADSYTSGATHRFVLSLGCIGKRMHFRKK